MELTLRNHTTQFEKVLQAIVETRPTLDAQIGAVLVDVGLLRADQRALADKVSETQRDLGGLAPKGQALQEKVQRLLLENGLLVGQEYSEEGWSSPKEKRRRRPRPRTKPSVEQVAEERSRLLRETTRFVMDPLAEASDHGN
ncbi:hypothetical protein NDU88_002722 [Pleurodeles waltl]|uniref:Uncharacterized protein n=1 Tax=Pleurodeles waltl TaxID=8319 RepID=A0AAV7WQC0_PLEWA|nr:hypothetical protein NDU88_002722 [Pleurodeles waltl]